MVKSHGHLSVEGYCKVDWARCLDVRRLTLDYCVFIGRKLISLKRRRANGNQGHWAFVGGNLISWRSKRQSRILCFLGGNFISWRSKRQLIVSQ